MQLSIEEVKKLDSNSYQIIDIRSEEEVAHGAIKGALNIQAEEIESDERVLHDKKLVIVCSRGKTSVDVAEYLTEKGFDAASLKGGYISWLLDAMKEDEVAERDIKADVEQSIRKKFKKSIWRKFTKAINTYELVKPGDKIAVCISGGKDSMLMAKLFQELKHHNKFDFDVKFLVMDPGYNPANRRLIEENAAVLRQILKKRDGLRIKIMKILLRSLQNFALADLIADFLCRMADTRRFLRHHLVAELCALRFCLFFNRFHTARNRVLS